MTDVSIDTNVYQRLLSPRGLTSELLETVDTVYVPLIVLAELRAGFRNGNRFEKNEAMLRAFLAKPGIAVLTPDVATSHEYASIYADLRRSGRPIPDNDLWIAALCVQHELALYTGDKHFRRVESLTVVLPDDDAQRPNV